MPLIDVVNGSSTTYPTSGLALGVNSTFTINAGFFQVIVDDDDFVFNGDQIVNETPDDLNQTTNIGGADLAIAYDYSFLARSGGTTYEFAIIDVDANGDGNFGDGTLGGADAGEQVYYIAVLGPSVPVIPPGGATFRIVDNVADNTRQNFDQFICFASGTRILTASGERPVETLRPNDMVWTADNGWQPLRWHGRRSVRTLPGDGPVRIRAGALGNTRDLIVSPQHRMVAAGPAVTLAFGTEEVLVAALHLVDGQYITVEAAGQVTYHHLLFDRHEIIFAEGIASESFHPGVQAEELLTMAQRTEIRQLMPAAFQQGVGGDHTLSRPCVRRAEAAILRQMVAARQHWPIVACVPNQVAKAA